LQLPPTKSAVRQTQQKFRGCAFASISEITAMSDRPQKITFAEVRDIGVRGLFVYCADYRCSHSIAISGDHWTDDLQLSDIEARFVCRVCGKPLFGFAPAIYHP
jgi:hypothetical protein